jgi:YrbI family 3-deoxy-D-manno-octulosonate 8-phosphate phosphatase
LVLDVDGVLTDGRIAVDARGREARSFHATDRVGVGLLVRAGIRVVVLVARPGRTTPAFARALGVTAVLRDNGQGLDAVTSWCRRRRIELDAVGYVGHDVLGLPLLTASGLAIVVADGAEPMRRAAHWVTARAGGDGVVREVAERILRAQGKWASTIGETWRQWD